MHSSVPVDVAAILWMALFRKAKEAKCSAVQAVEIDRVILDVASRFMSLSTPVRHGAKLRAPGVSRVLGFFLAGAHACTLSTAFSYRN